MPWIRPAWEPRVPPRFTPSAPESVALIDVMTELLVLAREGLHPVEDDWQRWVLTLRRAAFRGRSRHRAYSHGWAGIGETERLEVAIRGALAYAAVLVELRDVHMRD